MRFLSFYLFLSSLLFAALPINMQELSKLIDVDRGIQDSFGASIAVSGDTVVVGAPADECSNDQSDCGSVSIFERDAGTGLFSQVVKLTASDGAASDYFGRSVSISGDIVVIGAYRNDSIDADYGAAYIYEKGGAWADSDQESIKLTASDSAANNRFGSSVAISGDTIAVGAYFGNGLVVNSGSAYIYEKGNAWVDSNQENIRLTASDGANADYFGDSIAISSDTVVVGADGVNIPSFIDAGAAYIFKVETVKINQVNPSIIIYLLD